MRVHSWTFSILQGWSAACTVRNTAHLPAAASPGTGGRPRPNASSHHSLGCTEGAHMDRRDLELISEGSGPSWARVCACTRAHTHAHACTCVCVHMHVPKYRLKLVRGECPQPLTERVGHFFQVSLLCTWVSPNPNPKRRRPLPKQGYTLS